ncbi:MAG: hypothetical protein MHMPM18_001669 [Marteilia pararefringens]
MYLRKRIVLVIAICSEEESKGRREERLQKCSKGRQSSLSKVCCFQNSIEQLRSLSLLSTLHKQDNLNEVEENAKKKNFKAYVRYNPDSIVDVQIQFTLLIGKVLQIFPQSLIQPNDKYYDYLNLMMNFGLTDCCELLEVSAYNLTQFDAQFYKNQINNPQLCSLFRHLRDNFYVSLKLTLYVSQLMKKLSTDATTSALLLETDTLQLIAKVLDNKSTLRDNSPSMQCYLQPILLNCLDSLKYLLLNHPEKVKAFCESASIQDSIYELLMAKNNLYIRYKSLKLVLFLGNMLLIHLQRDNVVQKLWFIIQNLLLCDIQVKYKAKLCKLIIKLMQKSEKYQNIIIISNDFLTYVSQHVIQYSEKFRIELPHVDQTQYTSFLIQILAILSAHSEANRNCIASQFALLNSLFVMLNSPHFLFLDAHPSLEDKDKSPSLKLLAEASLNFILSFSRSVKSLRTLLYDIGAAKYIKNFILSNDSNLQNIALRISGNFSMVFSPFRDNFTDGETLQNIVNLINLTQIDEKSVIAVNVLSNLAYWSSRSFAEVLLQTLGTNNILNSSQRCLENLKIAKYSHLVQSQFYNDNNYLYLLNIVDFLRNATFERFENDDLVLRFKHLFLSLISDFFSSQVDTDFSDDLSKHFLLLALNCCNSKKCKSIFILNDIIITKILEILKTSSSVESQMIVLGILREMISFGSHGYKERIATLKSKRLVEILKRQIHNPTPKEKRNNKQFIESLECLLEIMI